MLRFAADENFNNNIIRGLLRRQPELDIIRVQDVGLRGADDPTVLEWAAQEGRVLLTHDVATITPGFVTSPVSERDKGVLSRSSLPSPEANSRAIMGVIYSRHST